MTQQDSQPVVLTGGHSTRPLAEFIALLAAHSVTSLFDVRSVQHSRHNPQFNRDTLQAELAERHHAGDQPLQGIVIHLESDIIDSFVCISENNSSQALLFSIRLHSSPSWRPLPLPRQLQRFCYEKANLPMTSSSVGASSRFLLRKAFHWARFAASRANSSLRPSGTSSGTAIPRR
jgi:hypothetical protein